MRRAAIAATAIFANWGIVSLITEFLYETDSKHFLEVVEIPEFEEFIQTSILGWEHTLEEELQLASEEAEQERRAAYYEAHGGWTESESD